MFLKIKGAGIISKSSGNIGLMFGFIAWILVYCLSIFNIIERPSHLVMNMIPLIVGGFAIILSELFQYFSKKSKKDEE